MVDIYFGLESEGCKVIEQNRRSYLASHNRKGLELGLSLIVGLLLGLLVGASSLLPLSSDLQKIIFAIPFVITIVILFNNPEKLILAVIAIGIPLNLDFSVIISPYARNAQNIANGNRTIMALTEFRVSLILIAVIIGYVLWLVNRRGEGRPPIRFFAGTSIPALGLILISMLSMLQTQDMQLSFFKVVQLVELFLIYFYLANALRTKPELQFFVAVFLGSMLAESILMLVQWQTGLSFSAAGVEVSISEGRAAGTLGTADAAGGIIAAALAIMCAVIWLLPRGMQKILAGAGFLLGCIALISTGGRAAWGSFVIVLVSFVLVGWRRGWVQGRSIVILSLITLVIAGIFYPEISARLTADDGGSAASRPMMFRLAWNVIQSSPAHFFFGIGANNYALVAHNYNSAAVGNLGYVIYSAVHNTYLLYWAEVGLIGLLFFLGFLVNPLQKVWALVRSEDRFISLMALGLGCGLVAMYIQMFVDPFIARPKTVFVWLLIALVVSLSNVKSIPKSRVDTQQT